MTIVVPADVQWRGPVGVRVRRGPLPPRDVDVADDGLRFTRAVRTAWDVAAVETTATAVEVLDALLRSGVLANADLGRALHDGARRWGVTRARRVLELLDGRAESPPESWVGVACALGGLPAPVPQYEVEDDGVWLARVDLAWPEQRLIVEYEGEHHFDGVQVVRDDARLARLLAAGWRVIRLSAADLRDLDGVVRRVAADLTRATDRS